MALTTLCVYVWPRQTLENNTKKKNIISKSIYNLIFMRITNTFAIVPDSLYSVQYADEKLNITQKYLRDDEDDVLDLFELF